MPVEIRELLFPLKGLNESRRLTLSSSVESGDFTVRCANVLGFDPRTGRNCGASRSGLRKFCPETVSGSDPVQNINHVVGFTERDVMLYEDGTNMLLEDGSTTMDMESASSSTNQQRQTSVISVAGGTIAEISSTAKSVITGGISALSSAKHSILSTQYGLDLYFADGSNYKIYDAGAAAITNWTATEGTLPEDDDGNRATLIETWAGRIVLAGLPGDGRNWFMSAIDDPLNWDYSPAVVTVGMAVAGNSSDAGQVSDDVVTALIPYTDDVLLICGDHSIYRMSGNPADGGRLDLVSDIVGVAVGRAWCKSPDGTVWFFGSRGGVYRMDANQGIPQRITANSIDERLADVHLSDNQISMKWDDRHLGVRLFVSPNDGSSATHFFYDLRNQAWWLVKFADSSFNPHTVHLLDGDAPEDRALLIGCQDGYVRQFDVDSTNDDGCGIESEVWFGPFFNVIVQEMRAIFSLLSGSVRWELFDGSSAEEALASGSVSSGVFAGGRSRSQWPRRHIRQGYLRLSATTVWSLESLVVNVLPDAPGRERMWQS